MRKRRTFLAALFPDSASASSRKRPIENKARFNPENMADCERQKTMPIQVRTLGEKIKGVAKPASGNLGKDAVDGSRKVTGGAVKGTGKAAEAVGGAVEKTGTGIKKVGEAVSGKE